MIWRKGRHESFIRGSSFFIGSFWSILHRIVDGIRHNLCWGAYSVMSILIALGGAFIWCGLVWLVLKFLGVCDWDDDEGGNL